MLSPEELRNRLMSSGLCKPGELRGCSDKELNRLESRIGRVLPAEYRKLMRVMGKGAGDFLSDLEMYYPKVLTLTDRMRLLVAEWIILPEDAVVVADRDGEQMVFFHAGEGDDPAVYRWHDEEPKRFRKVYKSIWDFIEEELVGHEQLLQDDDLEEDT